MFIRPPSEIIEDGKIWKLKRCLYGLDDAPREWYNRVVEEMLKLGGRKNIYDEAMFQWNDKDGSLCGVLVIHVDNFVYCGTMIWHENVVEKFINIFKISKSGKGSFKYIGLNIVQTGKEISVDQNSYIRNLKPITLSTDRSMQKEEELTSGKKSKLRSISGQILWVTSQTHPDASFDSCKVSNYGKHPIVKNLIEANKAIQKLQSSKLRLVYPDLGNPEYLKVVVYGDATHASLPSGASQGALRVFLCGNDRVAPITWKSKKLETMTKSPIASETMSLAEAADAGHFVALMVKQIFGLKAAPKVFCKTDNKSLAEHLKTSKCALYRFCFHK